MPLKQNTQKTVEAIIHDEAKRLNIPTTELSTVARKEDLNPVQVSYKRRDPDLDPQLIWRGKYGSDEEIDNEAWESLHSAVFRPFNRPKSGRIAVKVINHLGDEVMKVYGVNKC